MKEGRRGLNAANAADSVYARRGLPSIPGPHRGRQEGLAERHFCRAVRTGAAHRRSTSHFMNGRRRVCAVRCVSRRSALAVSNAMPAPIWKRCRSLAERHRSGGAARRMVAGDVAGVPSGGKAAFGRVFSRGFSLLVAGRAGWGIRETPQASRLRGGRRWARPEPRCGGNTSRDAVRRAGGWGRT